MIETKSITTKSSHWYDGQTGEPRYEIPCKTRDGTRAVTIKDARAMALVPSVTTISGDTLPAEGLVRWKIEQAVIAANACQPAPSPDTLEWYEWFSRVMELANDETALRADLGERLHAAIVQYEQCQQLPLTQDIQPLFESYLSWRKSTVRKIHRAEDYVPPTRGYGGRFDVIADLNEGRAIIDYKTKKTKLGKDVFKGNEYGLQLAAYAQALQLAPETKLLNVIISTTEPGRVEIIDWTKDRLWLTEWFNHLYESWVYLRRYDPRKRV